MAPSAEWDDGENQQYRDKHHYRRNEMYELVSLLRHDILFEKDLDGSGDGLENTFRAAAVWAEPDLEAAEQAAFPPDEDDDYGQHSADDDEYADDRRSQRRPPNQASRRFLEIVGIDRVMSLAVYLSQNDVHAAENNDQVSNFPADDHIF